jgi:hypothetical protein
LAQKPDGKAAKTERVTFTRPAAERIARTVRRVEQGDRGAEPLVFERIGGGGSLSLKVATFTGAWATGTTHVVSLGQTSGTSTSSTAAAYNAFLPVYAESAVQCLLGKVRPTSQAAWHVLNFNLATLGGFDASKIQLFGHTTSTGGYVQWYSITTCSTAAS